MIRIVFSTARQFMPRVRNHYKSIMYRKCRTTRNWSDLAGLGMSRASIRDSRGWAGTRTVHLNKEDMLLIYILTTQANWRTFHAVVQGNDTVPLVDCPRQNDDSVQRT